MDSQVEEIKNKLNVLDVVGSYVKLTKTGVNYRGLCPFHSEKGPSFFVSPGRQMWKCFGCSKGGDVFEFIKEIEGVEFGDALRILATKAGVELKRENPKIVSERKRLYEICDIACSFFEKQLGNSAYGKEAKDYLLKRGINEESIKKWRLGYSPDTWQSLSDFLVGRGYTRDEIVKAGLAVKSDLPAGRQGREDNSYDRFRGRIIFPILDLNSQVIGFGARIFKEIDKKETAKYINTPQTMLYDKSNVLYGINYAKVPIRKNNQCVLVEGYTDAIMCHQAGFDNTVAVSGTALTNRHLNTLKRYSDNLLLSFDMDLAGSNATNRGIDLAISQGFNIKVIHTYPGAKDPAEIILEDPKIWGESLKDVREIMDFCFDDSFNRFDKNTAQGRKEIENTIYSRINLIPNVIEQAKQRQKLAERFGVTEEVLLESFKIWKVKSNGVSVNKVNLEKPFLITEDKPSVEGRRKLLEDKIIALVIKNPDNLSLIEESHNYLFSERTKGLIEHIKKGADILQDEYKDVIDTLVLREEVSAFEEALKDKDFKDDGSGEVKLCILQLKDIELRNNLNKLSEAVKLENNEQKRDELIKEFNQKAKELHSPSFAKATDGQRKI